MESGDPRRGPPHGRSGDPELGVRLELRRAAQQHYLRGNRSFDRHAWGNALAEWRRASGLWRLAGSAGRLVARRLLHLRAVLGLLLTVALLYAAVFTLFPRDPFEMLLLSGGGMDSRSWWERFLDNGRPQFGGDHKMGIREWWRRFRRDLEGERGRLAQGSRGRPSIDQRWEELLRRYGRWGPFFNFELDYSVVAGYGLSRLEEYDQAVDVFQRGIAATTVPEKLADLYQGLANAHYYRGYRLQPDGLARYDLDMVRRSTDAYRQSVNYQSRPISLGNLGWMYFLLREYDLAEEYSRKALEMDPGLEYVRLNLGLVYLMEERVYDAFDIYRTVLQRNPPKDVYMGGINDLLEVIRDYPGRYPFAFLMVGLLALQQGEYAQARDALHRFQASPFLGSKWRGMAARLLEEMDTRELTR